MKLKKDEIKCDECDGTGSILGEPNLNRRQYYTTCEKCRGEGKLDWIETITGKKGPYVLNEPGHVIFEHHVPDELTRILTSDYPRIIEEKNGNSEW